MAHFLFATVPFSGHVNPGLPIARELVRRGHDVRWYTTPRFRRAVEGIGARVVPFHHAPPLDEENPDLLFPGRPPAGVPQLAFDIEHLFVGIVPAAVRDLEEELNREAADVIVGDSTSVFSLMLHERRCLPGALYGATPLALPSRDTAPFGFGLLPVAGPVGRLRNRLLYRLVDDVVFRGANRRFAAIRRELGLPPFPRSLFEYLREADLLLQASVPSFEYHRSDLPPQVRFIGASIPEPPADWAPPSWWGDLDGRRVVLLTQGTINNDYDQLVRPAIRALGGDDPLIVVTTGSRPPEAVEIDPLPANVRVERFVPYAHLMPRVDLLVTNGGYGSIQIALAHGVPVVAIGKTEEKPEIANRVGWSGVGIGLKVQYPSERQIRRAVAQALHEPRYRERARAIQREMAGLDAAAEAAWHLEELAGDAELERIA